MCCSYSKIIYIRPNNNVQIVDLLIERPKKISSMNDKLFIN